MTEEEIRKIIEMLAEKIGPMSEVVWQAYVRQAALTGMRTSIIAVVLGILAAISGGLLILFMIYVARNQDDDRGWWSGACFCDGLCFASLLLATIWVGVDAYMRIHNPAYYAIQMLLGR
jgi:hypothetical protein